MPAQYGDYARLKQGKTRDSDVQDFRRATDHGNCGSNFGSGEELERAVFFETDPYKPQRQEAAADPGQLRGLRLLS